MDVMKATLAAIGTNKFRFDSCPWGHRDLGNGKFYKKPQCIASTADLSALVKQARAAVQMTTSVSREWSALCYPDTPEKCGEAPMQVLTRRSFARHGRALSKLMSSEDARLQASSWPLAAAEH